jgi:flagella basal body P-ring formation protein FlgA
MSLHAHPRSWPAFAALAAASVAAAGDATTLEQRLRAARPEILRWHTQALDARAAVRADAGIVSVGRVGARTPVRYADGHVAWFAVTGIRRVLVSAHALAARAAVTAADATADERDVLALGCEPVEQIDATARWRTTRPLVAGAALCASDLERAPEVERDGRVTCTTQRGAIRVSRVFTAAADARTGERVRLRDRASGATLMAIVTGPGLARDPDSEELR